MVVDSIAQTSSPIPSGQICQAFDPIMLLPEKRITQLDPANNMSTSCLAPAYFYFYGSRGERFYCDYHFALEYRSTDQNSLDSVFEYIFDSSLSILETFDEPPKENYIPTGSKCWCGNPPEVMTKSKKEGMSLLVCNFHYRKMLYRGISNGIDLRVTHDVFDYRNKTNRDFLEEIKAVPII